MAFLTWLHYSDLHMCRARTGWDARRVLNTLQIDLRHMETQYGLHPDFIFFTGDAAFGQIGNGPGETIAEQFKEAHDLFEGVRTTFSPAIEPENVFLVPGNHDVDRTTIQPMETSWMDGQKSLDDVIALLLRKDRSWKAYMERLSAYKDFLSTNGYGHLLQDPDRLIYALTRHVGGKRIGIVGLNSAWSCGRDGERGKLWAGGRWQIGQLLDQTGDVDISIALIHHPAGWLVEHEEPALSQEIEREFNFHLHGHEHQGWVNETSAGHVRIAAAAIYDGTQRENGYNFVRINLETGEGEVWLRRYDRDGGGWVPRTVARRTDNDGRWLLHNLPFKAASPPPAAVPPTSLQFILDAVSLLQSGMEQMPLMGIQDAPRAQAESEQSWQRRVDVARDLIRDGQSRAARPLLVSLREEASRSAVSPALLSRIANNLGACALEAGEEDEAQICFQEALECDSGNPKALSNLAMVTLIQGDTEQALRYSTKAWEADATDPNTLGVHIQALHRAGRTAEAKSLIQENSWAMVRWECAAAIAMISRDTGKFDEAQLYVRKALDANPADAQLYKLLADLTVAPIQDHVRDARGQQSKLTPAFVAALEEAERLYSQATTRFEQQGNGHAKREMLLSRSAVCFLMGRRDEGLRDCEQVLGEEPSNPRALENKGRILLADERPAEAIVCFESLLFSAQTKVDPSTDQDVPVTPERFAVVALLADAYIEAGQSAKALPLLRPYWQSEARGSNQCYIAELLLQAYTETNDVDAAAEVLCCLERDLPDDPAAQAVMAEYLVRTDELPRAIALYQKAADHADPSRKRQFSLRLGSLYLWVREYKAAARTFAPFVDVQSDLRDIHAYVLSLYHGGSRAEAVHIAQKYRSSRGVSPTIAEIEAAVLEEAGSLAAALEVWQALIASAPRESAYRVQLASTQIRMGKRQDARETLLSVRLDDISENTKTLLEVAQLRAALKMPDVLTFAFRAWQTASGDAQVHGVYVELCMAAGVEESEAAQLAPEHVRIGDAVHLLRNGKTTVLVILDEEPIRADHGELRADSPRAKALLGKRKGETVSLGDGMLGSPQYEITEIMSKYVHACRETMRLLGDGTLHLANMAVGDITDPDFLPRMLDMMDRQSDQTAKIMAAYNQQPIPLSTVATLRHRSLVKTWLALTSWPDARVFAFAGTEEDAQAQASLISSTQEVVLDLVAVLSIIHLGIEDLVTNRFQKIMVAQALLDELHEEEHGFSGQEPHATIGSVNGQGYAFEMPVGHTRPALELVQRALYFISASTHVMGVIGLIGIDKEKEEVLGRSTLASILLAGEQGVPLYSDDLRTRQLAHSEWSVVGIDTQGVLASLHTQKVVQSDPYNRLLARMSQANYHFIRFDVAGLLSILEQNMMAVGSAEVRGAFRTVRGPDCTEESALATLAELVARVWHKTLLEHQKIFVLDLVLETLVTGRSLRVLALFRAHLKPKFKFTQFYLGEIYEHIKIWERRRIV